MQYQIELIIEYILLYRLTNPELFYGIIFGVLFSLISVIVLIYKIITARQLQIVKDTSPRYHALLSLNSSYNFYENLSTEYYEYFRVDTKAKFDRFNFNSNMKTRILNNRDYYLGLLAQIYFNNDEYKKYLNELNFLPSLSTDVESKMSIHRYHKLEEKLYTSSLLHPILDVNFYADLRYTSPKGRNSYHVKYIYLPHHIENLLVELKKEQNYKASKEYQRSLMTDSLRYDILKRDGFRCQICGKTANDGVQLHVDHIKPVSKGGKTIASNLRTLCDQCNLGKSDKWDEFGLN